MMQRVETVVVSEGHVGAMLQQQRQHIVAFLGYGIMQGRIAFGILRKKIFFYI